MPSTIAFGIKIPIIIELREYPNFDRACSIAHERAYYKFDFDDCGHSNAFPEFQRSRDCLKVEFETYTFESSMVSSCYRYKFNCWLEKGEDESDD
ncbi:MAG: hypothetical protein WC679_00285 [Bacteroidales bacterium]|jgi:hypothetical protein